MTPICSQIKEWVALILSGHRQSIHWLDGIPAPAIFNIGANCQIKKLLHELSIVC